jgi:hypothetical protein|tara:strand:- start:2175 stop:2321 length:147 start_codon:yes stop_codon:yes gene_type:complete
MTNEQLKKLRDLLEDCHNKLAECSRIVIIYDSIRERLREIEEEISRGV